MDCGPESGPLRRGGGTIGRSSRPTARDSEDVRGRQCRAAGGGSPHKTSLTSSVLGPSAYGRPQCTPGNCRPGGERLSVWCSDSTGTGKGWMAERTNITGIHRGCSTKKVGFEFISVWPAGPLGVPTQPTTLYAPIAGQWAHIRLDAPIASCAHC